MVQDLCKTIGRWSITRGPPRAHTHRSMDIGQNLCAERKCLIIMKWLSWRIQPNRGLFFWNQGTSWEHPVLVLKPHSSWGCQACESLIPQKDSMIFWNSGILPRKQAETSVCPSPDRAPCGSREAWPLMETWWVPTGTNAVLLISFLTPSWSPLSCCEDAQVKLSTKNCRNSCALHHPSHLPVFPSSYLSFFHSGWARTQRWQVKDKDLSFNKLVDLMPVVLPLAH